jgi:hypothetical protein
MKSFERWTIDEVEEYFHLHQIFEHDRLEEWLSADEQFPSDERKRLDDLRQYAFENIEYWNEEDLKVKFLGAILAFAAFDTPRYKGFLERSIAATFNNETLTGIVDFMVATGKANPKQPFFFLQEFKPHRGAKRDPLAQVLTAMLVARELNSPQRPPHEPLCGSYIIGRDWFFVMLLDKKYVVSRAFDSTQEDIFQIVAILRRMKQSIEQWLNASS